MPGVSSIVFSTNRGASRPTWQLPSGVPRGVWDYVHTPSVATEYDQYFDGHRLFQFDEAFVIDRLTRYGATTGQWIADLGCGTGRMLVALAGRGYRGLAVDLSDEMLAVVQRKAAATGLPIVSVKANLVELDGIASSSVDHAVSLFSTLGMIRGRKNRRQMLGHVRRILKPGGLWIFHVHNFWFNLYDPGGPRLLATNLYRSWFDEHVERGDRYYPYRGVANMFLHVFTRREIGDDLRATGFELVELLPLNAELSGPLRRPWFLSSLRASGWMIVCR